MKNVKIDIGLLLLLLSLAGLALPVAADPASDLKRYQNFMRGHLPDLSFEAMSDGMYNFSEDKRSQWLDIMEFPPYEVHVEKGQALFEAPLKDGKHYSDCFDKGGIGIAHTWPRFDKASGKVLPLAQALNDCRSRHGSKPLPLLKGELVLVMAYMAETSRGKAIEITVPDDPRALAAYEDGKRIYFTRRGPRDFACYHCHWKAAGLRIRGNELSPAIGQATHFPSYRSKWGDIGPLQRRYKGCMRNTGAIPLKEGSEAMNNLEYFHTFLSNGIPMNAPGTRF